MATAAVATPSTSRGIIAAAAADDTTTTDSDGGDDSTDVRKRANLAIFWVEKARAKPSGFCRPITAPLTNIKR